MGILQKVSIGLVMCLAMWLGISRAFGQNFGDRRAAMMDYAQAYWAWVDGGKVGPVPKADDPRLLMPTVGRMADPFGDAIITFAAMLEVDLSTAATRDTLEYMLSGDASLMASFRHYTLTGQLQSDVNSTLFHKHLHAFMQSIFDGTEWQSDGTASFDGEVFKTPDLKALDVGTVVPTEPDGTVSPYVPPTDLAPDVQDLVNRLREWTHRLRLGKPPGTLLPADADRKDHPDSIFWAPGFTESDAGSANAGVDCDDLADMLIAWLTKYAMIPEGVTLKQLGAVSLTFGGGHAVVVADMFGRKILIDPQTGHLEVGPTPGGYTRDWVAAFLFRAAEAYANGLDPDGDRSIWFFFYGEYLYGNRNDLFEDSPWFSDPQTLDRIRQELARYGIVPEDVMLPGGPQQEPSVFE